MKSLGIALGVVLFGTAGLACADDGAEAKALVEKAIKAVGGEAKLAKYPAIKRKGSGTIQVENQSLGITYESTLHATDKVRMEIEAEVSGSVVKTVLVYNGDKGWINGGGQSTELPQEGLPQFLKEDYRVMRLAELLTPLMLKEYKLTPLGELKIDQRPATGVKVSRKDHPDFDLFFDKETGLPVKAQVRVKEMKDGSEVSHEFSFTGYKEVDGLKCLAKLKVLHDGKRFLDVEWSDIKPLEKVDEGTFAKP